eukprot:Rmarinus@m.16784
MSVAIDTFESAAQLLTQLEEERVTLCTRRDSIKSRQPQDILNAERYLSQVRSELAKITESTSELRSRFERLQNQRDDLTTPFVDLERARCLQVTQDCVRSFVKAEATQKNIIGALDCGDLEKAAENYISLCSLLQDIISRYPSLSHHIGKQIDSLTSDIQSSLKVFLDEALAEAGWPMQFITLSEEEQVAARCLYPSAKGRLDLPLRLCCGVESFLAKEDRFAVDCLLRPVRERFSYHFAVGKGRTSDPVDRPEWLFHYTLSAAKGLGEFVRLCVEPAVSEFAHAGAGMMTCQIVQGVFKAAAAHVRIALIETLDSLPDMCRIISELLEFESRVQEDPKLSAFSDPAVYTSDDDSLAVAESCTPCLRVLETEETLWSTWLSIERDTLLEALSASLSLPNAFHLLSRGSTAASARTPSLAPGEAVDGAGGGARGSHTRSRQTYASPSVLALASAVDELTVHYRLLHNPFRKVEFLEAVQVHCLLEYLTELALAAEKFCREPVSLEDWKLLCALLASVQHIQMLVSEWSFDPFFINLHADFTKMCAVENKGADVGADVDADVHEEDSFPRWPLEALTERIESVRTGLCDQVVEACCKRFQRQLTTYVARRRRLFVADAGEDETPGDDDTCTAGRGGQGQGVDDDGTCDKAMSPAGKRPATHSDGQALKRPCTVSTELLGGVSELAWVIDEVFPLVIRCRQAYVWKKLAESIDKFYYDEVVHECLIDVPGKHQLLADMAAVVDTFAPLTSKPYTYFKRLGTARALLSLSADDLATACRVSKWLLDAQHRRSKSMKVVGWAARTAKAVVGSAAAGGPTGATKATATTTATDSGVKQARARADDQEKQSQNGVATDITSRWLKLGTDSLRSIGIPLELSGLVEKAKTTTHTLGAAVAKHAMEEEVDDVRYIAKQQSLQTLLARHHVPPALEFDDVVSLFGRFVDNNGENDSSEAPEKRS